MIKLAIQSGLLSLFLFALSSCVITPFGVYSPFKKQCAHINSYYNLGFKNGLNNILDQVPIVEKCKPEVKQVRKDAFYKGVKDGLVSRCDKGRLQKQYYKLGFELNDLPQFGFSDCKLPSSFSKTLENSYEKGQIDYCESKNFYESGYNNGINGKGYNSTYSEFCDDYRGDSTANYRLGYERGSKTYDENQRMQKIKDIFRPQQSSSPIYQKPISCEIDNHGADLEATGFCRNRTGKWRCYAEVEYPDESEQKLFSNTCAVSLSDCWESGKKAFYPACSNVEDR